MKDKIYKYSEFLKENMADTPEQYIVNVLTKLKTKIEKMFSHDTVENGEVKRFGELKSKERMDSGAMTFKDLGIELQSLELSKYSKMYDNIKLIFSDSESRYDVSFTIDLKDAVNKDTEKDFSDDEIDKCFVKFKKYDADNFSLVGQLTKTVKIKDVDEDLIIGLKIDLDKEYGVDEEEFEIQT